jgi:hypothetical protein
MATSLAAVVLAAGSASAQTPSGTGKTTWQPYPAVQLGTVVPLPSAAVPPVAARNFPAQPTPPTAPIGSRVVMYNKPSGEIRPVQATDTPAKPAVDAPKVDPAKLTLGQGFTAPDKGRVFSMPADDELFAEKVTGLRGTISDQIAELNKKEQESYRKAMEEYTKDPTKERPQPPPRTEDYSVSLSGRPLVSPSPTKPGYAPCQTKLEPGYVVHRRLLFEEMNSERYGWELGMAQPFVSAAYFYKDVLLWPAHLMSTRERYDTSAGKCPAGSPIPYYLYPPQVTIRGGIWEAAAVVGVVMLLP